MYGKKLAKRVLSFLVSASMLVSTAAAPVMADSKLGSLTGERSAEEQEKAAGKEHIMANVVSGSSVSVKFDFSNKSGAADGFTVITTSEYDDTIGYGLSAGTGFKNDKGTTVGSAVTDNSSLFDACKDYTYTTSGEIGFKVNLVAGTYVVDVYAGVGGSFGDNTVSINGEDLGSVGKTKPNSAEDIKKTATVTLEEDGFVEVKEIRPEGSENRTFLNAIVIEGTAAEPTEKYMVSYNLQGGTGTVEDTAEYTLGNSIVLSSEKPKKEGFAFLGWALAADSTDVVDSVAAVASNADEKNVIAVYAVWVEDVNYRVVYDLNGGTAEEGFQTEAGSYLAEAEVELISGEALKREGYVWKGWALTKDAADALASYKVDKGDAAEGVITLYAVWSPLYAVEYNGNGGTGTIASVSYEAGAKVALPTSGITREGYRLAGWALTSDAKEAMSSYTLKVEDTKEKKLVLYAVWQSADGPVEMKFDFGNKSTVDGYTLITNQMYEKEIGYGFTKKVTFMNDKGTNVASTTAPEDADLFKVCQDYTYTTDADGLEFQVDVPAGIYDVSVYVGLGGDHCPEIKVNGKSIGKAVSMKPSKESDLLKLTKVTLTEAGNIVVSSSGAGSGKRNMLNGLIIRSAAPSEFAAPQNVTQTSTETTVTLNWDMVEGAVHYNVFRSSSEDGRFLQIASTKELSYVDSVLTTNPYYYYVVAVGEKTGEDGAAVKMVSDPSVMVKTDVKSTGSVGTEKPAETFVNRALVAAKGEDGIFISWRLYESDSKDISFTLKRNGETVYTGSKTNFTDTKGKTGDRYELTASEGISQSGETAIAWEREYQELALVVPKDQKMPDGSIAVYTTNDMSVGDLDGDGELELIVKWYPSNAQDNSIDGYTGTTILDAYDIDVHTGKADLMWRIDLGLNIRSGAHYTQFQVWDYDGDGKAEVMCKTADGSTVFDKDLNIVDYVGACSVKDLPTDTKGEPYDYRQHEGRVGRIVLGDEYLTAFDGETGKIIDTVNYVPFRGPYDEVAGIYDTSYWGTKNGAPAENNDGYANRADRFLSATAYLDGGSASAVFSRGYYGRTAITAWKLIDGKLVMQWAFDADTGTYGSGQGNHGLSVNDVDNDGLDEIIFGGLVVDQDGTILVNTEWGHGDAMHVSDWNGDGKLEVYKVNEEQGHWGGGLYDPATGEVLCFHETSADTGRGVAADIDPRYEGAELWHAIDSHTHDVEGNIIYETKPSQNFSIFWDGDLLMELFDSSDTINLIPQIQKWNYENEKLEVLAQLDGTQLNNGTKGNAGLVADILGDWREEVIVRDSADNSKIRIYTTTTETEYTIPCFLEDRAYREGVAWQNVAYNQPANLTYLLTEGLKTAEVTIGTRTIDTVEVTWSEASDGKYGHPVQGYEVYRAEIADGKTGEFIKIGETSAEGRSLTDSGLKANTEYAYKTAMIVDGKRSYFSLPVSTKTTVDAAGLKPFEEIEIPQDTKDYEKKFPATGTLIDVDGNEQVVDVTWDFSNFSIQTAGITTVKGTIYGYQGTVEITVTVLPNQVISCQEFDDVYTLVGTEPELPKTAEVSFLNGTSEELEITWNRNYNKETVGSYPITGTCTTKYGESVEVALTVGVKEDYIVSVADLGYIEVEYGAAGNLGFPETVTATYAKGEVKEVPITWETIDTSVIISEADQVLASGTIPDYPSAVTIRFKVDYKPVWKFDFGLVNSPVEEGWIGIQGVQKGSKTAKDLQIDYTSERKYGFADASFVVDGRNQNYTKEGFYAPAVYQDMALMSSSTTSSTFLADVENGTYIVEMMSGSTDKSTVKVKIEGKEYSVGNAGSSYEVGRFEGIEVTDGQLTMEFVSGNLTRLNMIVIRKVTELENQPTDEIQQVEKILENLSGIDETSKLSDYQKSMVERAAETVYIMDEEQKAALIEQVDLKKLDLLYQKTYSLVTEVKQKTEAAENAVKLEEGAVTAVGAALASGAKQGKVILEIVQQQPKLEANAKIQLKMELKVNGEVTQLKTPMIISIEVPEGIDLSRLQIKHYTNDGTYLGTVAFTRNGRVITIRVNHFSIFTLTESTRSHSSGKGYRNDEVITSSGKWIKDTVGWWYRHSDGSYSANQWEKINNKWYFFDKTGYMHTGWVLWNGKWYYLKADGDMAENEWVFYKNQWYFLRGGNGDMATGWILWKNQWYYLNSNGDMAVSCTTPDGYQVNKDGVWIQ